MSTRLGVQDKTAIEEDFDRLFGRLYAAVPCPISGNDLPALYNKMIPPSMHRLVKALDKFGYNLNAWFSCGAVMFVELDAVKYEIVLNVTYSGTDNLLKDQFLRRPCNPDLHKSGLRKSGLSFPSNEWTQEQLAFGLGDRFTEFRTWVRDFAALYSSFAEAQKTSSEIVRMASTAGQLKRMVPEMLDYLPKARAEALRSQVRSSALPFEWAAYPRDRVRRMIETMAKCWLLTPTYPSAKFSDSPYLRARLYYAGNEG